MIGWNCVILFFHCAYFFSYVNAGANFTTLHQQEAWPNLSSTRAVAIRTQRDISENATIIDDVVVGVNITSTVFESFGYTSESLAEINTLLDVGVQALYIDLYYNEYSRDWSLCPLESLITNRTSERCESPQTFNITSLIGVINNFISLTDNVLNTNPLYLLISVHSIVYTKSKYITEIHYLESEFQNLNNLITPSHLNITSIPSLQEMLFTDNLRTLAILINDDLLLNTTYKENSGLNTMFISSSLLGTQRWKQISDNYPTLPVAWKDIDDINNVTISNDTSSFRFTYSRGDISLDTFVRSIKLGYSPIISQIFSKLSDISVYLEYAFWSWAVYQPTFENTGSTTDETSSDIAKLERCAIITTSGWKVVKCGGRYRVLCQNSEKPDTFAVSKVSSDFLTASESCYDIGSNYVIAVPTTVFEQDKAIAVIPSTDTGLWIDVNSLSSSNCWVKGLSTVCPYQKTISKMIFIRMITPGAVIAFILLLLLILLQFNRVPVHQNRRRWRKLTQEQAAKEVEGVPS
ncbi:hypothetical protein HII13_003191 [Brettanomyces bruxellensis]|uniref:Maintenance of telomere capping protein 6 n=1 Tax=Dekkera bruxellensis TaxID=5007 RepID=A0A7D9CY31_DEKBR|nr:hypothetical protein HII13_003191 [Brettanomyces bruxellensis]VUG18013.1 DEBR0S3_00210g1_1 [Brettanomyces bruxellensis]